MKFKLLILLFVLQSNCGKFQLKSLQWQIVAPNLAIDLDLDRCFAQRQSSLELELNEEESPLKRISVASQLFEILTTRLNIAHNLLEEISQFCPKEQLQPIYSRNIRLAYKIQALSEEQLEDTRLYEDELQRTLAINKEHYSSSS